jgi:hypothetical protein
MLKRISDLPDGVIGFMATGEVTKDDYEQVLTPAVAESLQRRDKLRLLYILGASFSGFSGGAMWEDTKVGVAHLTHWERIAVVSDKDWLRHSVNLFGYLIPGQVKAFTLAEESEARGWIID